MADPACGTQLPEKPTEAQLDSWKEIAAYLGRDVTTVQRWEKCEAMPVHRHVHDKRSSVYALTSELDAWRQSRKPRLDENNHPQAQNERAASPRPAPSLFRSQALHRGSGDGSPWPLLLPSHRHRRRRIRHAPRSHRGCGAAEDPVAGRPAAEKHDWRSQPGISRRRDDRCADRPPFQHSRPARDFTHVGDAFQESANLRARNRQDIEGGRDRGRLTDAGRQSHSRHRANDSRLDGRAFLVANLRPRAPRRVYVQSELAQSIAEKVEATATGAEHERLAAARPVAPEVYESYSRGQFALNKSSSKAELEASIPYFEDAIKRDPTFAPAYVGLANAYSNLGTVFIGGSAEETRPKVVSAAEKALELDPNLAEALVLLASMKQKQWHWADAEAEYRRALELDPNSAAAYEGLGLWLACQGRADEAVASAERGRELDPLGVSFEDFGWTLFQTRHYDQASRELRAAAGGTAG